MALQRSWLFRSDELDDRKGMEGTKRTFRAEDMRRQHVISKYDALQLTTKIRDSSLIGELKILPAPTMKAHAEDKAAANGLERSSMSMPSSSLA